MILQWSKFRVADLLGHDTVYTVFVASRFCSYDLHVLLRVLRSDILQSSDSVLQLFAVVQGRSNVGHVSVLVVLGSRMSKPAYIRS